MSILKTRHDYEDRYNYTALDNPRYEILNGWRSILVANFIEQHRNRIWNNELSKSELISLLGINDPRDKIEWLRQK